MKRTLIVVLAVMGLSCHVRRHVRSPRQFFDSNGVRIAYIDVGKGDPVVLVHGLDSSVAMNWELPGIVDELSPHYRVIALDLPGHGQSDKPHDPAAYGMAMVNDVTALLDRLGIQSAHMIGYSMGGMIVLKLAAVHPERTRSALLGGMGWLQDGSALQRMWASMPTRPQARTPSECMQSFARLALTRDELMGIRVPMEIVVGDRDPMRLEYVRPMEAARPDVIVRLVEDAGHLNCIVKPQFKHDLLAWLDEQRGTAAGRATR